MWPSFRSLCSVIHVYSAPRPPATKTKKTNTSQITSLNFLMDFYCISVKTNPEITLLAPKQIKTRVCYRNSRVESKDTFRVSGGNA